MNWEIHAALRFFSKAFKNGGANPWSKLHHFNHKPPIIQSYMGPHIPGLYHWMVAIYQSSTHNLPPFTQIRAAHAPAIHPLVHLNGAKWAKHGAIALQLQRLLYITVYCISINIYIYIVYIYIYVYIKRICRICVYTHSYICDNREMRMLGKMITWPSVSRNCTWFSTVSGSLAWCKVQDYFGLRNKDWWAATIRLFQVHRRNETR